MHGSQRESARRRADPSAEQYARFVVVKGAAAAAARALPDSVHNNVESGAVVSELRSWRSENARRRSAFAPACGLRHQLPSVAKPPVVAAGRHTCCPYCGALTRAGRVAGQADAGQECA